MPRTTPAPPSAESTEPESRYQRIYSVVRRIPEGRVATYGQVASLADLPGHARQVGYALHALKGEHGVPWQRVINARGEVSPRSDAGWEGFQRLLGAAAAVAKRHGVTIPAVASRFMLDRPAVAGQSRDRS